MLTRAATVPELAGSSPQIVAIRESFTSLSGSSEPVLICGEHGTGKEELARALHRHHGGLLSNFVLVAVDEHGPHELESLLFGKDAAFARADEGTVYLQEVGALTPGLQARLLGVLQDHEFHPSRKGRAVRTGARIMAGTSEDLAARAEAGMFNASLLAALGVHTLYLPPLRERRQDLDALITHFLSLAANELSVISRAPTSDALDKLRSMDWPGNLPQLEHVCRRVTAFTAGREITLADLPDDLDEQAHSGTEDWASALHAWARDALAGGEEGLLHIAVPEVERILIGAAMDRAKGRRQEAARLLGWGRNTLSRKIRDLGLNRRGH